MRTLLGISAYYHDSAAALLVDGGIVAAAQEERFSRRKNDERFPEHAVLFCLKQGGRSLQPFGVPKYAPQMLYLAIFGHVFERAKYGQVGCP